MKIPRYWSGLLLLVLSLGGTSRGQTGMGTLPPTGGAPVTVFSGARLIDGTGRPPIDDSVLMVRGDRIESVSPRGDAPSAPAGSRTIDTRGLTIMPGLISAHSHLGLVRGAATALSANFTRENVSRQLAQYEGYGVTAVMSLGTNQDVLYDWREEQRGGQFPGADIFTADRGLGVTGGAPPFPLENAQIYRPQNADEARRDVREMISRHPDILKLWLDDLFGTAPRMAPAVYEAALEEAHSAIAEAHAQGYRFAAHCFYLNDAKDLLERGLNVVAHSVRDQTVDARFIELMMTRNAIYIPTLALDESEFVYAEHPAWMTSKFFTAAVDPGLLASWNSPEYAERTKANRKTPKNEAAFAVAMRNVKILRDAGVTIAMGTDSGAMPTRIAGFGEHHELALMVQAGLTPMEAIVAATRNSARVLGVTDRGTLEPGKRADFLVLNADPLADIHNTTRLNAVWHGGVRVNPCPGNEDGSAR